MGQALLVIDIDRCDGWDSDIEELDDDMNRKQVALAIMETLEKWRASNAIIVFIVLVNLEHPKPKHTAQAAMARKRSKCIVCDLPEDLRLAGFLEHRHGAGFEPAFIKRTGDAFSNSELSDFLRSKGVTKVVLAGCNTFMCVQETALGAARNGFGVTLLERCTYPPFSDDEEKQVWIRTVASVKADIPVAIA